MEASTPHFFSDCLNLDGDPIMGDDPSSAYPIPTTSPFVGGPSVWSQAQDVTIDPAFSYFDESFGTGRDDGYVDREVNSASSTTTPTTQYSVVTKQSVASSNTSISSKSEDEDKKPKTRKNTRKRTAAAATTMPTTTSTAGVAKSSRTRSGSTTLIKSEDESKRNKFLERNRIAAYKCRQKKKEWVNELEERTKGLETRHSTLQHELNALATEVSEMKNQLMAHAGCHDPNITRWIENEARRFVQNDSRRISHGSVASSICDFFDTPRGYGRDDSISSMSPQSPTFGYDHMPDVLFDPALVIPKTEDED
jgi:hypothetical protein